MSHKNDAGRRTGVLVMAYGSAPSLEDEAIRTYLRHILQYYRRQDPKEEEFGHLKERYRAIAGSPLYRITESVTSALQKALDLRYPGQFQVFMAMKHSPPFIEEAVGRMAEEGIKTAAAVALSPFRSRLSTEGYYHLIGESNARLDPPMGWSFAADWHLHPLFLHLWQERMEDALDNQDPCSVVFTNHSLPARIQEWDDPYTTQFEATAQALAGRCRLKNWTIAYQSKGGGEQPWLGPELAEVLEQHQAKGSRRVLAVPIGFLMDHLEILYDLDIGAQAQAHKLGIELSRTQMPNADPLLVALLADVVVAAWRSL